jgi:hypothetical protein
VVEVLYAKRPDPREYKAFGLTAADFPEPECDVWPDNWLPFTFYLENATQWRQGMNGATGLDYNVLFYEMDRKNIHGEDRDDLMMCIREIENAALDQMYKKT